MSTALPVGLNLGIARGHQGPVSVDTLRDLAIRSEAAGFAFILVEDGYGDAAAPTSLDAIAVASFLGNATSNLGVVAGVHALYLEPFDIAEALATLDFDVHGRSGWLAQRETSAVHAAAFDRTITDGAAEIASEIDEFVGVVGELFDGWEDGAVIRDAQSGAYLDVNRIHRIDHRGPHLGVRGPLVTPRPPQGRVPSFIRGDIAESVSTPADFVIVAPGDLSAAPDAGRAAGIVVEIAVQDPGSVVDVIARWSAADGIAGVILTPTSAAALEGALVPGRLPVATQPATLRDLFGLQRPPNVYATATRGLCS